MLYLCKRVINISAEGEQGRKDTDMSKDLEIRIVEDAGTYKVLVDGEEIARKLSGDEVSELTISNIEEQALAHFNYLLHC